MELRKGRHVVYQMHAHLVFVSKYRGKCFTDEILVAMEKMMRDICQNNDVILTEFNGETDHIHILVEYKPTLMLSKLVNALKGTTSRELKKAFPELNKAAWGDNALWSPSYYCGSVGGASTEIVAEYIKNQARSE